MKLGIIYRMTSPSLKAYIGQTSNSIEQRHWMYKHPETMRGQRKLKHALLKYGYDAFTVEVFEVPRSDLSLIEALIIAQEDSFENGYNGTEGGEKGHQKLDSELKYGVRESDDPCGFRTAKARFIYAENASRILNGDSDITLKIINASISLINDPKRAAKRCVDVETIFTVLTSEPKFAKEIGELVGMSDVKVGKLLKTAVKAGLVKVVTLKNKETGFRARSAYYFPSAEESERDMKVAKLTEVECPKMRVDSVSDEELERTECPKVWGDVVSDEELRELAKGHGWRARDARRILKMRAEKRAREC